MIARSWHKNRRDCDNQHEARQGEAAGGIGNLQPETSGHGNHYILVNFATRSIEEAIAADTRLFVNTSWNIASTSTAPQPWTTTVVVPVGSQLVIWAFLFNFAIDWLGINSKRSLARSLVSLCCVHHPISSCLLVLVRTPLVAPLAPMFARPNWSIKSFFGPS